MFRAAASLRHRVAACAASTQVASRFASNFAVVHVGGKQYKVAPNDVIVTNKLDCEIGKVIRLEKVLLAGSADFTMIGTPLLSRDGVKVTAMVTEQSKGAKIVSFKKKRRQGYIRKKGHRQDLTFLRIQEVDVSLAASSDHQQLQTEASESA
eukprot:m.19119 g.19119  ORF g.19119 m.19119 type:complete len:152 (+) comp7979_c0_seq1:152-607(+)